MPMVYAVVQVRGQILQYMSATDMEAHKARAIMSKRAGRGSGGGLARELERRQRAHRSMVLEAVMVSKGSILAHRILLRPPQVADRFGRRLCLAAHPMQARIDARPCHSIKAVA